MFTLQAFNGRVVTEWLSACLHEALAGPYVDERLSLTYCAMPLG